MLNRFAFFGFVVFSACEKTPDDTGANDADASVDLLREFPEAPEGSLEWVTPEYEIPAFSEQQWCVFGTYEDETVGIIAQQTYQSANGHHVVLTSTTASPADYPDGTVLDCTDPASLPMTDLEPLIVVSGISVDIESAPNWVCGAGLNRTLSTPSSALSTPEKVSDDLSPSRLVRPPPSEKMASTSSKTMIDLLGTRCTAALSPSSVMSGCDGVRIARLRL